MRYHRQYICLLLQVISFVSNCLAENLILNINFKNPITVTDHAFLSFTLDPTTLQHNDFISNIEKSTNLARGLAPAYIRFGGPQSNFYNFEQVYSHEINMEPNNMHFGTQWTLMYQWAKNAGLDVIACITPYYIQNELKTNSSDPRNIAELLSFSDRMGYNISWQLGYECQTRCDLSGEELGRYVVNLHEMLKTFPRYSNSLITGPDIIAYKTAQQQKYLQDYLHSANIALSAITWHPDLDSISLNNNISIYHDNMIAEKDELYKIISHKGKKSLWIAESKSQESKHQYLGALIWMRRLGDAAKLGIQVVMRQLTTDLSQATPIYWVSLLYKTLVGHEVLEIKLQSNNESYVHFYSQCTKSSAQYSKGAITIFGINLTTKNVTTSLKGLKIEILHKYILSSDCETGNKMFSEKVLLNNKPLNLINDKKLPDINPEIIINPDGLELELPSNGIGFWVIPNAKVKACTCSEEEIIENNVVKKLSKRHENNIQQDIQEEKEGDINQSNVVENDVKENENQSNLKNRKVHDKYSKNHTQESIENNKTESLQKVWSSKLFAKIKRILQKKSQKMNKNELLQRSFIIDLGDKQENSSEEVEEQQNLNKKGFKKMEVDDEFESIRDILKKYKFILLNKKAKMETEDIQHFKPEIKTIDNAVTLISKIDVFLLYKITSNESIMSENKNKTKNEEESMIKINKTLKKYLIELEDSTEVKANVIKKIEKYFYKLYNLLEYNKLTKDNKNQIFIGEGLIERKRFKRHLDRKSENSKKIRILKKRSQINDLKDYMIKQKKNDNGKKLILFNNIDNLKKNFINNEKKYNNLFQQDSVKRFFKNDALENTDSHIDQHSIKEHNRNENDNIYRKHSKISDMKKYQSLMQESERTKRDISKKLVEVDLRKDSASRKRSKIDDLKNYVNERKKQKDDMRRGLLIPFNPRTTDSDENNFYGFFRRDPVKGFPESDIFVTAGDSLEKNGKDYDYVEDEDDSNDSSMKTNMQHNQKSTSDRAEDNTWIEEVKDDDGCDYMPNELFENFKLSNTKIKENFKNYDDLWEAEFPFKEHNNENNEVTVTKDIQEQSSNNEKGKHTRETSMKHLVNHDNFEKQEYNRDALRSTSRYPSMSSSQLLKIPTSNINYQASNLKDVEFKGAKLKMETESKKNSFYLPFQTSIVRYNYNGNYETSSLNYNTLKKEIGFDKNIDSRDDINVKTTQYSRPSIYTEHSTHDKTFHNERSKRSNWKELRKIFAKEMTKEDKENARDCHFRVIRASNSSKKPYLYRRVKGNVSVASTTPVTDISLENESVNINVVQSMENPITREDYEEIMTGEILSNDTKLDYEGNDTTTKSIITKSTKLDHELNDATQTIDLASISKVNNVSDQYHSAEKSNLLSVDSDSKFSLNSNNNVEYVTTETFFRSQPSDIQSENKTNTYDSTQIISSENKDTREKFTVSVTNKEQSAQETICEKIQDLNKNEKTDCSIYPTITEDQKNEEGYNNDYTIGLKSTNSLKETTKRFAEQMTTETTLLQAASITIDNLKSDDLKTKSMLLQNTKDNQNSKSEIQMQLTKDANTRRLKTTPQNLPRTSSGFTRHEERLTRRTEQIDKRKEKLYARWEKLLHSQYQDELVKIADEQKRNLKKREASERLHESDDFHRLIDQKFIGILLDDDITYEDDDKSYLIPIKLVPKQYKNIIDQIFLLAKAKKVYYPILQTLLKDTEELAETSKLPEHKCNEYIPEIIEDKQKAKTPKFLDREHNQDCQYSSKTTEDERESTETTSRSSDRKIFIIDSSTYYGGEPILHEDYLKFPTYHSRIKSQIQNSTRWILRNIHQALTRLESNEHQAFKSQEYIEKLPIKDYYDKKNTNNVLYILDTQHDLLRELIPLAQVWLSSLNPRDSNQTVNNREANKLNNVQKSLKIDEDNLDSTFVDEKTEFTKDFEIERNIGNKEFGNSNNRKKDTMNSETIEDAEDIVKFKKSENMEMIKHEEMNDSHNSNDKAENNLNIIMFNNNNTVNNNKVEKITEDKPNEKEFGTRSSRFRRNFESCECPNHRLYPLHDDSRDTFKQMRIYLKDQATKKIFEKDPTLLFLLTKNEKPPLSNMLSKLKNYFISPRRNFKVNQQNQKEHDLNYIMLIPIGIKNTYEILNTKNNDDSLEPFEIPAQWDDQYVREILDSIHKYLNDETSDELEYEDLSNLQSEKGKIILDDEDRCSCENKQGVIAEDSKAKSEKDEQYRSTNDENKFLKIKDQIGSNKHGTFLSYPWKNVKIRQRRQIKSEIQDVKCEVTGQSQLTKSIPTEGLKNKHTKRYLNNIIAKEEDENWIEMNNERVNNLQLQTNRKNHDDLLEDFIKTGKNNSLYNNEASSIRNEEKNEIIPLNNISIQTTDKKILQKEMPKLQNHMKSIEKFVNDSEENYNDTLASDEDKYHRNRTSETTGNVVYTAITNIKDFLAFFSKVSRIFTHNF